MTRAVLATLGATNAIVLPCDFTQLSLPAIDGRTAYIGNPPYVRHHDLPADLKAWSVATARRLGHRADTFTLAGLHAVFYVAIAAHAATGDVGCLVTSQEWLDTVYGAVIRGLLLNGLGGRAIHIVDPTAVPFSDAMTTAAISCFEVGAELAAMRLNVVQSTAALGDLDAGSLVSRESLTRATHWSRLALTGAEPAVDADSIALYGASGAEVRLESGQARPYQRRSRDLPTPAVA